MSTATKQLVHLLSYPFYYFQLSAEINFVNPFPQVSDVKKIIETVQGADVYPASQQMLIHQGKVLKDTTTLEENQVAENSFIVIMLTKVSLHLFLTVVMKVRKFLCNRICNWQKKSPLCKLAHVFHFIQSLKEDFQSGLDNRKENIKA